jgi:type I restriction enzyme S subunit
MQKEKQLTPQLRFKEFTTGWQAKSFHDLLISSRLGGNYSNSEIPNDYPLIKMGNLGRGYIKLDKLEYIDENEVIKDEDRIKEGDLFFNTRNTLDLVGKVAIWKNELPRAYYNSNLMYIKFENNNFMNYNLNSFQGIKKLRRIATGTTSVAAIYSKDLFKLKFNIPSLKEQQKIAHFLTSIDHRIQTLEKKKTLLAQYKKGVMQKIFSQEIRFKDTSATFSAGDGKEFPEWNKKKLGELTYKVGKKNKQNIQYPIYSINNQEGFRPQSEQFEGLDSNDRGYDISLYKIVNKETFAYNPARINVGSIGYSYELNEVIISSLYVCFKTKKELDDLYLLAYLDTDRFNKDILRYQEGGVRQYLFYENFSQIKIPLPSNEEQIKIANFLSAIDKNIVLVTTKIEHTKAYKKGLLQQMFV